jgi:poly(3-hydroxybutyrate) depolymerase
MTGSEAKISYRLSQVRRTLIPIISLFICLSVFAQQTPKSIPLTGFPTSLGYLEYLPPGYDDATENFPVLIFLHGGGEEGDGSPGQLERVKVWGPPRHIDDGHNMCFDVNDEQTCFIVISPQIVSSVFKWPSFLQILIDHILEGPDNYKADPNRIYLTGLSRGGNGVYSFASNYFYNRPNTLAAIAPISAWSDDYDAGCLISSRQIPAWAFHGKKDTVIPYAYGLNAFNSVQYCTTPSPTAEMIFTTYDNVDGQYHDAWIPAYDPSHKYHNPNLYEWLLLHTRPEVTVGIDASEKPAAPVSIYQTSGKIDFHLEGDPSNIYSLTIFDVSGKRLSEIKPVHNQKKITIYDLQRGIYLVNIRTLTGQSTTTRFIKTH